MKNRICIAFSLLAFGCSGTTEEGTNAADQQGTGANASGGSSAHSGGETGENTGGSEMGTGGIPATGGAPAEDPVVLRAPEGAIPMSADPDANCMTEPGWVDPSTHDYCASDPCTEGQCCLLIHSRPWCLPPGSPSPIAREPSACTPACETGQSCYEIGSAELCGPLAIATDTEFD